MALKSVFRARLEVNSAVVGNREWDAFSGGKYTAKETKYMPYNGVVRTYVDKPETENITLEANFEPIHRGILAKMGSGDDLRGQGATVTVFDFIEGTWVQNRPPLVGKVMEIQPPDGDSDDASTIEKIKVIVSVEKQ